MRLLIAGLLGLVALMLAVPAVVRHAPVAGSATAAVPAVTAGYGDGWNSIAVPSDAGGQFMVAGMVNGAEVTFLVDSGASEIVLSPEPMLVGPGIAPVKLRFTRTRFDGQRQRPAGAGDPAGAAYRPAEPTRRRCRGERGADAGLAARHELPARARGLGSQGRPPDALLVKCLERILAGSPRPRSDRPAGPCGAAAAGPRRSRPRPRRSTAARPAAAQAARARRPEHAASARIALAIGPSLPSMLSGRPITEADRLTLAHGAAEPLAGPWPLQPARRSAAPSRAGVPGRCRRARCAAWRRRAPAASRGPAAGRAKAAALSHTVKACSFRGRFAARPVAPPLPEPGDLRACRSTRPPWPALPCSHGSRCRRTQQERLAGELSQIVQLDRAAGRGRHRRRRADALGDAAAAALARRRGQRRQAPRRRSWRNAPRAA